MISIKNVSNVLQAWEYVKINVIPDTISWPSDSVIQLIHSINIISMKSMMLQNRILII